MADGSCPATIQRLWEDRNGAVPGSIYSQESPRQLIRRCNTSSQSTEMVVLAPRASATATATPTLASPSTPAPPLAWTTPCPCGTTTVTTVSQAQRPASTASPRYALDTHQGWTGTPALTILELRRKSPAARSSTGSGGDGGPVPAAAGLTSRTAREWQDRIPGANPTGEIPTPFK